MEKRAVEVFVPAVGKKYDILLVETMKIGAVTELIAKLISEQEQVCINADNLVLGIMDTQELLEDTITVRSANLNDGATLILV